MMKNFFKNITLYVTLIFAVIFFSCNFGDKKETNNKISVGKALGNNNDSIFRKVTDKRKFIFPDDHGPHQDYKNEWWYFTGNLETKEGRNFGYQFTIFRIGLKSDTPENNIWESKNIYMGHFTLSDIDNGEFFFEEKLSRDGNKLAGAETIPFKVWIENWKAEIAGNVQPEELKDLRITAATENYGIDLTLNQLKNIILQGDDGFSRKGSKEGNASYYYSITRLQTKGKIRVKEKEYEVAGLSWFDREWSTSVLDSAQKGWDWFSLQLNNNVDFMFYQMRKNDGTPDKFSSVSIIDQNGSKLNIPFNEVKIEVTDYWINPDGKKYPSGWKIGIPALDSELIINPAIKNQEVNLSVRYWEGSVIVTGVYEGKEIKGRGYVELTGYSD